MSVEGTAGWTSLTGSSTCDFWCVSFVVSESWFWESRSSLSASLKSVDSEESLDSETAGLDSSVSVSGVSTLVSVDESLVSSEISFSFPSSVPLMASESGTESGVSCCKASVSWLSTISDSSISSSSEVTSEVPASVRFK